MAAAVFLMRIPPGSTSGVGSISSSSGRPGWLRTAVNPFGTACSSSRRSMAGFYPGSADEALTSADDSGVVNGAATDHREDGDGLGQLLRRHAKDGRGQQGEVGQLARREAAFGALGTPGV